MKQGASYGISTLSRIDPTWASASKDARGCDDGYGSKRVIERRGSIGRDEVYGGSRTVGMGVKKCLCPLKQSPVEWLSQEHCPASLQSSPIQALRPTIHRPTSSSSEQTLTDSCQAFTRELLPSSSSSFSCLLATTSPSSRCSRPPLPAVGVRRIYAVFCNATPLWNLLHRLVRHHHLERGHIRRALRYGQQQGGQGSDRRCN